MPVLLLSLEKLLSWENVSRFASLLSIASFGLTVGVLFETRRLRMLYKLRVRGPVLIRDLHKMADNVSDFLDEYSESIIQIAEEFGKVQAKLKSIEIKLKGGPKASVKRVRNYIDR